MKKVSTLFKILLGFAAGIVSGAFIHLGFEILENRPVSVGGEALIIPLIILLFCLGFSVGKEVKVQCNAIQAHDKGFREGYRKGRSDRRALERHAEKLPLYLDAEWQPSTPSASGR